MRVIRTEAEPRAMNAVAKKISLLLTAFLIQHSIIIESVDTMCVWLQTNRCE